MNSDSNDLDYDRILDEASSWVSRLHNSSLSESEQKAFSQWLSQSPSHEKAYDEMTAVWTATELTKHSSKLRAEAEYLSKRPRPASMLQRVAAPLAIAASVLLPVGMMTLTPLTSKSVAPVAVSNFATSAGEQESFELEDGSIVTLNTRSRVEVKMTDDARWIRLLEGETYFDVAKDEKRPFTVFIDDSAVTAVGTAFNIYKKSRETVITIVEGVVEIKPMPQNSALTVDAHNRVRISGRNIKSVRRANVKNDIAWQQQQLVVRDIRLSSLLLELNRYLEKPVRIRDAQLHELKVSGTFDVHDPEQMLKALIESFNLVETFVGKSRIISAS